MRRRLVVLLLALAMSAAGCSSSAPSPGATPHPAPPDATVSADPSPITPLVGQWSLQRTCVAMVEALAQAGLDDLVPQTLGELVEGVPENEPLPATWDPSKPCADAKPPTAHSHSFWADGTFNSYDEDGNQVDDSRYRIIDDDTVQIGEVRFHYRVLDGNGLVLSPAPTKAMLRQAHAHPRRFSAAGWAFTVAFPGQTWARVTSGPHVPPGTGTTG